jgi:ABC-type multidrug transport system fused ATPase/permease subunit
MAAEAQEALRERLVAAFMAADWLTQLRERPGQLQELVTLNSSIVAIGTQQAARVVATAWALIAIVTAAVLISIWVTLSLVAVGLVFFAVGRPLRGRARRLAHDSAALSAELASEVSETGQLAAELRVAGADGAAEERLRSRIRMGRKYFEALRRTAISLPTLMRDLALAGIVLIVAAMASRTDISLTALGAAVLLVIRALNLGQGLAGVAAQLQERQASLVRVRRALQDWDGRARSPGTTPCARIGRVQLDSVSFTYPRADRKALSGIDIELHPGEELGLIGPSGAGKSTLAMVVLGLLEPQEGRVLVEGVPQAELSPADWRSRVGWVPQEPGLLTATVGENIRFLRPGLSEAAVRSAARAASLDRELEEWPDGLDHSVGPAGRALSVGQRQRIVLARALAGEPDLLVLDEPTSALDAHTEAALRKAILALRGRTTVLVIAHRLSTVQACSRVAVLDDGQIRALGPPDTLAETIAYYREALALSGMTAR